jgi:hypothetical protein
MLKRFKDFCLTLGVFSLIAAPFALTASVYAQTSNTDIQNGVACGTNGDLTGAGSATCGTQATQVDTSNGGSLNNILKLIINIFSVIVGFVAVIMIIFGGIRYITSGGDSGNISSAKNTIVYAIVGLIIVALAQVLVHFVIGKVANAGTNSSAG